MKACTKCRFHRWCKHMPRYCLLLYYALLLAGITLPAVLLWRGAS